MAAPAVVGKGKGPIINPAKCRCCREIKKCRVLTAEYEWMDQKEVYSDMFMDCFGLLLSHLDSDSMECCVCATCVVRLRDACAFRRQVLSCEQAFLQDMVHIKEYLCTGVDKKVEVVMQVKAEPLDDDLPPAHLYDSGDSEPLADTKLALTKMKSTSKTVKTRKLRRTRKKTEKDSNINIRDKLDAMLNEPAVPKECDRKKKKKMEEVSQESMCIHNALTIAQCSYVCPFVNRTSMLYCYYCKDQFTNPDELRSHTLTHDPNQFESMIEYNKLPKMDITRIDCRLCPEKIETIDNLKTHLSNCHGKMLYQITNEFLKFKLTIDNIKCIECNQVFPYIDSLMKHMIEHFGTHICDQCGACFLEVTSLRSHIKTHSKVETNFPCEICGKNLKSKYSRYLHVATVHEKRPTVNCYKCEESFLSYALRNKHLIEVHGDKRTFPCKLCDKVYNRRKTLVEHNRRNHLKVYRHQCDLCDQRFYLPSRLKEHMATHTGERNFRCEFCDKSYPRLQSLQEHVRSHNQEKRHKCQICGSGFTQLAMLRNHVKTVHEYEMDVRYN